MFSARNGLCQMESEVHSLLSLDELIAHARRTNCSDIHLTVGMPVFFRRNGAIEESGFTATAEQVQACIEGLLTPERRALLAAGVDVDFSYASPDGGRQRVNLYSQQGLLCAAVRILQDHIPDFDTLGLPHTLRSLAEAPRGLVLVTGPTGSGKSTTMAAMIQHINREKRCHIITIEDPIEYQHENLKSIVHQREVGRDVKDFHTALRSALREDPDVILVGEMRDLETISAAITAAETGHLVLGTLHTVGAANTVDRIIDVFPPHSQQQVRSQLSGILRGVVTQQLLPRLDGSGRVAAFEIMIGTDAVLNLIRENKAHQLFSAIQTGARDGMCTLDSSLSDLVRRGVVEVSAAAALASSRAALQLF